MAIQTVRYYPLWVQDTYSLSNLQVQASSKDKIVWESSAGDRVILEGEGLRIKNGMLSSGAIEDMTIINDSSERYIAYSQLSLKREWFTADTPQELVEAAMQRVLDDDHRMIGTRLNDNFTMNEGNHVIDGAKGQDTIAGGVGIDRLIGGKGGDTFIFLEGFDKDVIVDFDAVGGGSAQDFIDTDFASIDSIKKAGDNVVIDYGGGDTLTLLNVKRSDIDPMDFI